MAGQTLCPNGIHCVVDGDFCCSDEVHSCKDGAQCCYDGGTHCTDPDGFCCGIGACDAGHVCCDPYGCGPSGSTCCGKYYCNRGTTCCPGDYGCAAPGSTCCGQDQCTSNEQCCDNGNGCAPSTATCCGPDHYCDQGSLCCQDQDQEYYCATQCVETFIIDRNDYDHGNEGFDKIFENMCRGILKSTTYSASRPNEIVVKYNGKGDEITSQNRVEAGCRGRNRLQCVKLFGTGWSCDKFPFASTQQGGANAAIMCVPASINSAIGGKWGNFLLKKSKSAIFRIKIVNFNCGSVSEPQALLERDGILANDTNVLYLNGSIFANYSGGNVAMLVPLNIPDDFVGTFDVNYAIAQGSLISGSIIDDDGEDYGDISITESGQNAIGSINVPADGVGNVMILGWANDIQVSLNVSTSLSALTSTSTTAAASSTSASTVAAASLTSIPPFVEPTLTSTGTSASTIPTGGARSGTVTTNNPSVVTILLIVPLQLAFFAVRNDI